MSQSSDESDGSDTTIQPKRLKLDPGLEEVADVPIARPRQIKVDDLPSEIERLRLEVLNEQDRLRSILEVNVISDNAPEPRPQHRMLLNWKPSTQCRVAMVGSLDYDKFRLINALLDSNNVLPMHISANTAVEIHYNEEPDVDIKATFHYITEGDWHATIHRAKEEYDDLDGDLGLDNLQKVKAVYPSLDEEDIATMDVESLMMLNPGKDLLGTSVTINQDTSLKKFHQRFDQAVGTSKGSEYKAWPLVDRIHLYVRHSLLAQGLVLVVVPGIDAYRGIVYPRGQEYLSKCSAICVMVKIPEHANSNHLLESALYSLPWDGDLENLIIAGTRSEGISNISRVRRLDSPEIQDLRARVHKLVLERDGIPSEIRDMRLEMFEKQEIIEFNTKEIPRWKAARAKARLDYTHFRAPRARLDDGGFALAEENGRVWDQVSVEDKIADLQGELTRARERYHELEDRVEVRWSRQIFMDTDILDLEVKVFEAQKEIIRAHHASVCLDIVKSFGPASSECFQDPTGNDITHQSDIDIIKARVFCTSSEAYTKHAELKNQRESGGWYVWDDGKEESLRLVVDIDSTEVLRLSKRLEYVACFKQYHELRKFKMEVQRAIDSLAVGTQHGTA